MLEIVKLFWPPRPYFYSSSFFSSNILETIIISQFCAVSLSKKALK